MTYENKNQILQKVDRLISGNNKVTINRIDNMSAPAYADIRKKQIFLNQNIITGTDNQLESNSLHKGLNYHELAHIIFTKTNMKKCSARQELNLLEDSKIENLFSLSYPKSKKYFKKAVLKLIDKTKPVNHLLIYGRRHMFDKRLIESTGKLFEKKFDKKTRKECELIIDKYLKTTRNEDCYKLAYALNRLLEQMGTSPDDTSSEASVNSNSIAKELDKDSKEKIQKLSEKLKEKDNEEIKEEVKKSGEKSDNDSEEDIQKLIDSEIDTTNEEIETELSQEGDGYSDKIGGGYSPKTYEVKQINELSKLINDMKTDLKNGYKHRMKKGKFDMKEVMKNKFQRRLSSRVFKKYLPDRTNDINLGVTMQIDSSGSMSVTQYSTALSAAYTLSTALEKTKSQVEIYEFSSKYQKIKDIKNRNVDWKRHYSDGTNPSGALEESYQTLCSLKRSGQKNLVNFLITDGEFYDCSVIIEKMNKLGAITVLIKIGRSDYYMNDHKCKHTLQLNSAQKLMMNMKGIIKDVQSRVQEQILNQRGEVY